MEYYTSRDVWIMIDILETNMCGLGSEMEVRERERRIEVATSPILHYDQQVRYTFYYYYYYCVVKST